MSENSVRHRLRRVALRTTIAGCVLLAVSASIYADAFSIVARAARLQGPLRRAANLGTVEYVERVARVPAPGGEPMRVRIYVPERTARQTVLLVAGLHPAGIDEPRLMGLARELARSRFSVVTPDIPALAQFTITAALTDEIERVARWVAADADLAPAGMIGLIGVSFSGGLAMVAAGRPSLSDRVLYVFSIGGHDDLPRVLRYLVTGARGPADEPLGDEGVRPPHDYGLAVVLLNVAERLVPADQVDGLREIVRRFLKASSLHRDDEVQAKHEFASAREDINRMPEPSGTLLRHLIDRDVERLGSRLLPHVGDYGNEPALSPSRSPPSSRPVFLLHGREDDVIPASESQHLADRLRGHADVKLLLTDVLSHADIDRPKPVIEVARLMEFVRQVLSQSPPTGGPARDNAQSTGDEP
jgi:acetyl esterase/lipase